MKNLKQDLKIWNIDIFWSMNKSKKKIINRINDLDKVDE